MLTTLHLKNFKCFRSLSLPLRPLTLLTGFNAAGKSTSLQTLLVLAQALRGEHESTLIPLNGELVKLGSPGEVLSNMEQSSREMYFGVDNEKQSVGWCLHADGRSEGNSLRISKVTTKTQQGELEFTDFEKLYRYLPISAYENVAEVVESIRNVVFISAVRRGTEDVFPGPESAIPIHSDVGMQGEFAPWWFDKFIDEEIESARCNPKESAKTLRRQFNAWAGDLFPGAEGNVQRVPKTNLIRLELRLSDTDDWQRPSNIGYGLTYAFPIIVAGLIAKTGQTLIIDSPEAHLHPLGQSRMGYFLARIAASGVQVIVETHSDHVLNGARLAVRDSVISQDDVAVHFFNHPQIATGSRVVSPVVGSDGGLSEWPEGFFDQSEKDLAKLAGW